MLRMVPKSCRLFGQKITRRIKENEQGTIQAERIPLKTRHEHVFDRDHPGR